MQVNYFGSENASHKMERILEKANAGKAFYA